MIAPVQVLAFTVHWMLFAVAGCMATAAWFVYVWAVRTGQFQDVEGTAERMLENEGRD
jgi:cbb3-type cytochrome oxidase maturation protein